ncbi:DUF3159 domain-containing protein [Actinomyces sp. MRS3W]|uniref:DUF3159 domain-containing protein n=1 Tax=Actinomyces sp. MRS3W TaxID=2800796 RepID=UPI0028FD7DB6|nr:DUF3159 domain-containing protein [Actinomyces sp. MRS3W]MDU0347542.1 DUF3159 domain-containing protein [Actinomyces sp. MRS3W]
MSAAVPSSRGGLGTLDADRFDVAAAVGGWRGVFESAAPTLVFVLILAVRPTALVPALLASLTVSAVGLAARLVGRQPLTQVLGGAALAGISALWAWRSGSATNFYATGLLINAVWLAATGGSLLVRWPLVGVLLEAWHAAAGGSDQAKGTGAADAPAAPAGRPGWGSWRTDPARAATRRRYAAGTAILAAMFALRLVVEVPLYLAGETAVSALGVARLVLGVPLFALTLWFVWLVVTPSRRRH